MKRPLALNEIVVRVVYADAMRVQAPPREPSPPSPGSAIGWAMVVFIAALALTVLALQNC